MLIRLVLDDRPGSLASATGAMARQGVNVVAMDVVERDGSSVVDDFVVEADDLDRSALADALGAEIEIVVDCMRESPQAELHRELELLSTLTASFRPSLDLLVRLVPAIVFSDSAVIITSDGQRSTVSHAGAHGPHVRWRRLEWLPLTRATTLDPSKTWVPASLAANSLELCAAPIDPHTSLLVARFDGPSFRRTEVERLARLGRLAGALLQRDEVPAPQMSA